MIIIQALIGATMQNKFKLLTKKSVQDVAQQWEEQ